MVLGVFVPQCGLPVRRHSAGQQFPASLRQTREEVRYGTAGLAIRRISTLMARCWAGWRRSRNPSISLLINHGPPGYTKDKGGWSLTKVRHSMTVEVRTKRGDWGVEGIGCTKMTPLLFCLLQPLGVSATVRCSNCEGTGVC